jgi:hypothetical protein
MHSAIRESISGGCTGLFSSAKLCPARVADASKEEVAAFPQKQYPLAIREDSPHADGELNSAHSWQHDIGNQDLRRVQKGRLKRAGCVVGRQSVVSATGENLFFAVSTRCKK